MAIDGWPRLTAASDELPFGVAAVGCWSWPAFDFGIRIRDTTAFSILLPLALSSSSPAPALDPSLQPLGVFKPRVGPAAAIGVAGATSGYLWSTATAADS